MRRFLSFLFVCCSVLVVQAQKVLSEYEYWIDTNDVQTSSMSGTSSQTLDFSIDTQNLSEGLHILHYRIQDSDGMWSPLYSWHFYNLEMPKNVPAKVGQGEYWIDNLYNDRKPFVTEGDSTLFSIDASAYGEGLHTLNYRVKDVNGNYSPTHTWIFTKMTQRNGRCIAWCKYWWNNHEDMAEIVNVEDSCTEYSLSMELTVPRYAQTDGYSSNFTARLNLIFGDDSGNVSSLLTADVSYPDCIPPTTSIEITEQTSDQVSLKWSADEDCIEFYNVYVSEDEKPFVLWLPNTTATSAVFKTKDGVSYRFLATSRDMAGNMEKYDEERSITNGK